MLWMILATVKAGDMLSKCLGWGLRLLSNSKISQAILDWLDFPVYGILTGFEGNGTTLFVEHKMPYNAYFKALQGNLDCF